MNRILMILVTLLLVSCAKNNDNFLLDEILFGKEDPNAPIVNLDNQMISAKQSEQTKLNAPITDLAGKVALNNSTDKKATAATLISISDKYCANNSNGSEYKNELKQLAKMDSLNTSIINKLLKCYDANQSSKNQQNSCIVYVCKQEIDKARKIIDMSTSQNLINKGKAQELIDINNAQKAIDMNKAQELIDRVRQNNLNAQKKKNIQNAENKTNADNKINKPAPISEINTANTKNPKAISKPSEPVDPERERSILLQQARAGNVDINDKNLDAFCRMSAQLVFYVTNNLIMVLNSDYPRSITSTLPKVGIIDVEDSFAYKALKITENRLDVIKEKLKTTLPFNVVPHDSLAENYQASYYDNCLKIPNQYIFNYNRIFNTNSEPQWSSFLRRQ